VPTYRRGTQLSGATDRPAVGAGYRAALTSSSASGQRPKGDSVLPWDPLLGAVSLYILTSVGRIQQLFPALEPLRPTLIAGILCIVLFLLSSDRRRSVGRLGHPITWCALTLLALVALSVPFGIYPRLSLTFLYDDFAKTVVLFLVVAGSVRSYADVRRLSFVFLLSATIYCTVLIVRTGGVGAERMTRGYSYDPNDIALFVVSTLPFALFGVASARRLPARLLGIYTLVASTLVLVKTGSRGGFLAAFVVLVFFGLLNRAVSRRARIALVGTVVGLGAVLGTGWYWQQMRTIRDPSQDYNMSSPTGRVEIWKRGIGYMLSRPLTGVGAACFESAEGKLAAISEEFAAQGRGWKWSTAHNSFVLAGAELGVPGLVVFTVLLYQVLRTFLRASGRAHRRQEQPTREVGGLAFAGAASLVGFAVAGFFLSQTYSAILYTLAGLAVGLAKVREPPLASRSGRSKAGHVVQ